MSAVYPKFAEKLLSWALNDNAPSGLAFYWLGVNTGYVYDPTHNDLADISVGNIIIPEAALTGVTIVDGIVKANPVNLTGLPLGATFDAIIVYMKAGDGTSYLAAYIDESNDGSIPQVIGAPTGTLAWNASGIFQV